MWCNCDLKTEAFTIAVIHMLGSSVSILTHLILLPSNNRIPIGEDEDGSANYATANALAFSIVSCVTDGLLLHGVIKEYRFTIIPWLVLHSVALIVGTLLIFFLPLLYAFLLALLLGGFLGYPWYTIFRYFRSLDPHNPAHQPQTAVYAHPQATTGFTNQQFIPDKPAQPDTVVFTPGLPSYNDIVAQPQNV